MTREQYDALGADAFALMLEYEYSAEHPTPYRDVEFWRLSAENMRDTAMIWWQRAAEAS